MLDKQGVFAAFRSSRQLVSGNWWRTTFVLSSVFGITIGFTAVQERIISNFSAADAEAWPALTLGGVLCLLDLVATPIMFSAGIVAQRNDLKRRVTAISEQGSLDEAISDS